MCWWLLVVALLPMHHAQNQTACCCLVMDLGHLLYLCFSINLMHLTAYVSTPQAHACLRRESNAGIR